MLQMKTYNSKVTLPYFKGFNRLAIWPSPNSVSSYYGLISKQQLPNAVPSCKVMEVPFFPGCLYAAYEAEDCYQGVTATYYNERPEHLIYYDHTLDVTKRKACDCQISFGFDDETPNSIDSNKIKPNDSKTTGGRALDDDDLISSDDKEESEEKKRIKDYAEKKSMKQALIDKTSCLFDVKPLDEETPNYSAIDPKKVNSNDSKSLGTGIKHFAKASKSAAENTTGGRAQDDDVDLFGSVDKEQSEEKKRLKADTENKSKKQALIDKNSFLFDLKPLDEETPNSSAIDPSKVKPNDSNIEAICRGPKTTTIIMFGDLKSTVGVKALNEFLAEHSYIGGYVPSQDDTAVYEALDKSPKSNTAHALRWYNHIKSFGASMKQFAKASKSAAENTTGGGTLNDDDLFGSDDNEESEEKKRITEKRLKAYAEKKSKKQALNDKTSCLFDIKPLDEETDMDKILELCKTIEMDGLLWGDSKLVPIGNGIKKLQLLCVIEDAKISIDELQDKIMEFEDYIQAVDVAAMNNTKKMDVNIFTAPMIENEASEMEDAESTSAPLEKSDIDMREPRTGVPYNQPRAIPNKVRSKELNDWMRSEFQNGGFPKDQNLIPQKGDPSYLSIAVQFRDITMFAVKRNAPFRNLRKNFCKVLGIKASSVRFYFDGERISSNATLDTLEVENGDIIEAFKEIDGGGWARKKDILLDPAQILEALQEDVDESDSSSDDARGDEDNDIGSNTHTVGMEHLNNNATKEKVNEESQIRLHEQDKESSADLTCEEVQTVDEHGKASTKEDRSESLDWLDTLRKQYDDGILSKEKPLDNKIIFFLQLPKLCPVEMNMLKNLSERRAIHAKWESEKISSKKRKVPKHSEKVPRNLRSKQSIEPKTYDNQSSEADMPESEKNEIAQNKQTTEDNKSAPLNEDVPLEPSSIHAEMSKSEENKIVQNEETRKDNNNKRKINDNILSNEDVPIENPSIQTPEQRKQLLDKFDISTPSPIMKLARVTEVDMRRLSLAVHLWAEGKIGGIKILQDVRLKDKHFEEILAFAGPGSKWNILKNRPIKQLKNMWRNSSNSTQNFRGNSKTGLETDLLVHSPSSTYCPFNHCKTGILNPIEMDLVLLSPGRISIPLTDVKSTSRQLFTSELDQREKNKPESEILKEAHSNLVDNPFEEILQKPPCVENQITSNINMQPSPSKEELKKQNKLLLENLQLMKHKYEGNEKSEKEIGKELSDFKKPKLLKCKIENCGKEFKSIFGLNKHQKRIHTEEGNIKNEILLCNLCGKEVVWIDKHMKAVHGKDLEEVCEICQKVIKCDFKKHRGQCISCPYCLNYKNEKKLRLLNHISNCKLLRPGSDEQRKPLDLTSPRKVYENTKNKATVKSHDSPGLQSCDNQEHVELDKAFETVIEDPEDIRKKENVTSSCIGGHEGQLHQRRIKYPFDDENGEEYYMSEYEEEDSEEFTMKRRCIKDEIEKELRHIDGLENPDIEGDNEIVEKFRKFMQSRYSKKSQQEGYSKMKEVSTVANYTRAVEKDILTAFHRLFNPFDSRWVLDCKTKKDCKFEGEIRTFVNEEEPIYFTSRILREALRKYDEEGFSGGQRANVLKASVQFMDFIELHFDNQLNLNGREPLEKVMTYHNGVKTFLKATNAWKTCNEEKARAEQKNKTRREYEHPNQDAQILEQYQKYIKSPERLSNITKILKYAAEGAAKPSNGEMTELGQIVMGEIITSTGCRPVVPRHLTVGSYVDKKPGFNPFRVSKDDCILEEEHENIKIYRRVNPNIPPKDKACKHQLEQNKTVCPELCDDRCDPEGYNIFCTWDKTHGTKGPSFLHLAKPIKDLVDFYDIVRSKFFKERKSPVTDKEDWLNHEDTPFFLNSACSHFKSVPLKHISEAIGIDVTAYSFRRIVSTWALSHESEEIREAEEEALQHTLRIAKDKYLQNKQIKPQTLTQRYIEEEQLFPEHVKESIQQTEIRVKAVITEVEDTRQKRRIETLMKENETAKQLKLENRPLGPTHRILGADRNRFKELIEQETGENLSFLCKQLKPLKWRSLVVRAISIAESVRGDELRKLWVKIYKGDLKWGVRDARQADKAKNWPRRDSNCFLRSQDRNSWIASYLKTSFLAEMRSNEKKNYIKQMKT